MKGLTNILWWFLLLDHNIYFFLLLGSFLKKYFFWYIFFFKFWQEVTTIFFFRKKIKLKKQMLNFDYLIDGESIVVKGLDTRPFALFKRRQIFAVTNSRIIRLKRKLLGGFDMLDYQWGKGLKDAQISKNVFPRDNRINP
ncbi:MAG: hypothetical protein CM15mP129_08630 [Chloroflexota bacterium]|nr:MAG: hypothetical protein CM15mP129_08630 [Chloroflexota bacterium]